MHGLGILIIVGIIVHSEVIRAVLLQVDFQVGLIFRYGRCRHQHVLDQRKGLLAGRGALFHCSLPHAFHPVLVPLGFLVKKTLPAQVAVVPRILNARQGRPGEPVADLSKNLSRL